MRFAGRLVDGFVVERVEDTEHDGRLAFLAKVVSSEPVLHPEVLALARAVADRYAGTLGDVLRLAIPPRHARAEAARATRLEAGAAGRQRGRLADVRPRARLRRGAAGRGAAAGVVERGPRSGPGPAGRRGRARDARLRAAARSCACPTSATSRAGMRCSPRCSARAGTSRSPRPTSRPIATGRSSRPRAVTCRSCSAPARRRSRRSATSVSWRCGTTATTCSPSRARPTRTPARSCCCAPRSQETALLIGGHARTAEGQSLIDSGWCLELAADQRERRRGLAAARRSPTGRPPAQHPCGSRRRRSARSGRPTGRCWSRSRGAAIASRCPARRAASRPAAPSVRARWASRPPRRRSRAAGAAARPRRGPARTARAPSCVRRSSGRCARPRSSPARSPTSRS